VASSQAPEVDEKDQTKLHRRRITRAYHVFNATQVDGYVSPAARHISSAERIEHVENFFWRIPVTVKLGGDHALLHRRRLHPDSGI